MPKTNLFTDVKNDLKPSQMLDINQFEMPVQWVVANINRMYEHPIDPKTHKPTGQQVMKVRLELVKYDQAMNLLKTNNDLTSLKTIECLVDDVKILDQVQLGYHEYATAKLVDPKIMVHPKSYLPGFTDSVSPYRLLAKSAIINKI